MNSINEMTAPIVVCDCKWSGNDTEYVKRNIPLAEYSKIHSVSDKIDELVRMSYDRLKIASRITLELAEFRKDCTRTGMLIDDTLKMTRMCSTIGRCESDIVNAGSEILDLIVKQYKIAEDNGLLLDTKKVKGLFKGMRQAIRHSQAGPLMSERLADSLKLTRMTVLELGTGFGKMMKELAEDLIVKLDDMQRSGQMPEGVDICDVRAETIMAFAKDITREDIPRLLDRMLEKHTRDEVMQQAAEFGAAGWLEANGFDPEITWYKTFCAPVASHYYYMNEHKAFGGDVKYDKIMNEMIKAFLTVREIACGYIDVRDRIPIEESLFLQWKENFTRNIIRINSGSAGAVKNNVPFLPGGVSDREYLELAGQMKNKEAQAQSEGER